MDMIKSNKYQDSSGRLFNPGKRYVLQLTDSWVRDLNQQLDEEGLNYGRKAMIITAMTLNTNGKCEETQLTPALQRIVHQNLVLFDAGKGLVVSGGSLRVDAEQ